MTFKNVTSPRRTLMLATAVATLSLAACGGGGSSGATADPGTPTSDPVARAAGPLDPVQTQLESAVLAPLASALAGTPLEGVVDCANELVNYKILDTVDVLAGGLALSANPADLTSLDQTLDPDLLTQRVRAIAFDTTQLLLSLNDQGSTCASLGNSVEGSSPAQQLLSGDNPLAGTPLNRSAPRLARRSRSCSTPPAAARQPPTCRLPAWSALTSSSTPRCRPAWPCCRTRCRTRRWSAACC